MTGSHEVAGSSPAGSTSRGGCAEFFFDPIFDIQPTSGDLYPYCTSDQVRFFEGERDRPMELRDVPLLVLTETMRDVDLFIGVTSIGADPEWLDRGEGRRFETYWNAYAFGELTAAAEIRREVLEHLLPQLAIADRCELEDGCLVVRGDLRTYRIHLGSSNILMSRPSAARSRGVPPAEGSGTRTTAWASLGTCSPCGRG